MISEVNRYMEDINGEYIDVKELKTGRNGVDRVVFHLLVGSLLKQSENGNNRKVNNIIIIIII